MDWHIMPELRSDGVRSLYMFVKNYSILPIGSVYGIQTYIWWMFILNVGKYTINGSYGLYLF